MNFSEIDESVFNLLPNELKIINDEAAQKYWLFEFGAYQYGIACCSELVEPKFLKIDAYDLVLVGIDEYVVCIRYSTGKVLSKFQVSNVVMDFIETIYGFVIVEIGFVNFYKGENFLEYDSHFTDDLVVSYEIDNSTITFKLESGEKVTYDLYPSSAPSLSK